MDNENKKEDVAFFSRCKPWSIDCSDIAINFNRIFFGYAIPKEKNMSISHAEDGFIDISQFQKIDKCIYGDNKQLENKSRIHNMNCNFVQKIDSCARKIAVVPSFKNGVIYCGYIKEKFRLSYNDEAHKIFCKRLNIKNDGVYIYDDERTPILGELMQGWDVEEFHAIPFPMFPASLRRSLYGRSTYGILGGQKGMQDAFCQVSGIIDEFKRKGGQSWEWSNSADVLRSRLKFSITPSLFEHLVVSLLQLEESHRRWLPVGGSGDGGVDGIAVDEAGKMVGILQCKLHSEGNFDFGDVASHNNEPADRYFAYMSGKDYRHGDVKSLDIEWVVRMLMKHHRNIPLTRYLRIGTDAAQQEE